MKQEEYIRRDSIEELTRSSRRTARCCRCAHGVGSTLTGRSRRSRLRGDGLSVLHYEGSHPATARISTQKRMIDHTNPGWRSGMRKLED
jgi:hypothetical protein